MLSGIFPDFFSLKTEVRENRVDQLIASGYVIKGHRLCTV